MCSLLVREKAATNQLHCLTFQYQAAQELKCTQHIQASQVFNSFRINLLEKGTCNITSVKSLVKYSNREKSTGRPQYLIAIFWCVAFKFHHVFSPNSCPNVTRRYFLDRNTVSNKENCSYKQTISGQCPFFGQIFKKHELKFAACLMTEVREGRP